MIHLSLCNFRRLDSLDHHFAELASRVENIDMKIDLSDPESLLKAKNSLAQVIADLEKLQLHGTDAVHTADLRSGQRVVAENRKVLNREIDSLLDQTRQLYVQLERAAISIQSQKTISPSKSTEPDLSREEMAKLLLLVSRAHKSSQISIQKKAFLKSLICRQDGNLRNILKYPEIGDVLKAISNYGNLN